jgi:transcriptional regulator with XRE-family HTH domain
MKDQTNFYLTIGKNIHELRTKRELTIEQFSNASGLDLNKSTMWGIENGRQRISIYQLFLISKNLNVSIESLLKGTENENPGPNFDLLEKSDTDKLEKL